MEDLCIIGVYIFANKNWKDNLANKNATFALLKVLLPKDFYSIFVYLQMNIGRYWSIFKMT